MTGGVASRAINCLPYILKRLYEEPYILRMRLLNKTIINASAVSSYSNASALVALSALYALYVIL